MFFKYPNSHFSVQVGEDERAQRGLLIALVAPVGNFLLLASCPFLDPDWNELIIPIQ